MEPDRGAEPASGWPAVVCLGEAVIDLVAVESDVPLQSARTFVRAAGGAPANVAVALARLGIHAAFLGKIATDAFGRSLAETLAAEGVNVTGVVQDGAARTPLVFVGSDGHGGRSFVFYHDGMADTLLRPEDVSRSRDLIAHARVFHFGSVTLSAEPSAATTLDTARLAREFGCLVSFDPNVRLEVWDSPRRAHQTIVETFSLADVVKVSNDELEFLADTCDPAQACERLRGYGPRFVVVTLGADGCYYDAGSSAGYVPGVPVQVIDTLGAGDAFLGGLLAGLTDRSTTSVLDNQPALIAALRFANVVGAITTTRYGAIPALPTRADVEHLLTQH
jgi:fructokinase